MEAKHTPGPWFAVENPYSVDVKVGHESYSQTVGNCQENEYIDPEVTRDVCIANAKLMAAAPELLAALQECVKLPYTTGDVYNRAKAAINKALNINQHKND